MSIEANDKARLVKCVPSQLYCSYAVFSRNREIRLAIFRLTSTDRHGYQYTWSSLNFEVPSELLLSMQHIYHPHPTPQPPLPASENNLNHSFVLQRRLRNGYSCPFPHLGLLFWALAALQCEYTQQSTITQQPDPPSSATVSASFYSVL